MLSKSSEQAPPYVREVVICFIRFIITRFSSVRPGGEHRHRVKLAIFPRLHLLKPRRNVSAEIRRVVFQGPIHVGVAER